MELLLLRVGRHVGPRGEDLWCCAHNDQQPTSTGCYLYCRVDSQQTTRQVSRLQQSRVSEQFSFLVLADDLVV